MHPTVKEQVEAVNELNRINTNVSDHLYKMWKGFNKEEINKIVRLEKPILTIAMLSWLRLNKLLLTLEHTLKTVKTPLNICLHLQGIEDVTPEDLEKILSLLKRFHAYKLIKTQGNIGTGVPRHDLVHTAFDTFNTPYVITLDDDVLVPFGGIEAELSLMETHKEVGAISLMCKPKHAHHRFGEQNPEGQRHIVRFNPLKKGFIYVDAIGSATQITRKEVFDTCDLDTDYQIGMADFDFCMQMYEANWKIASIHIPELQAVNNAFKETVRYKQGRANKEIILKSKKRFLQKWNVIFGN